jgi:hypothetical protein
MLKRLLQVNKDLWRGSCPSPKDVITLYKHLGIRKIVSLDEECGKAINKVCKILGIKHITIPIDGIKVEPLLQLFNYDLKDLLTKDGPTYVHCIHGKDRTGMVIAMFKCKYMGMSYEDAIREAENIGFGDGLPEPIARLYKKIIEAACKSKGEDYSDTDDIVGNTMVDNTRPHGDYRDSIIDGASMPSFAPYMDTTRGYPFAPTYNYWYQQSPTRENKDADQSYLHTDTPNEVPIVGEYDSPTRGFGPSEPASLYDTF